MTRNYTPFLQGEIIDLCVPNRQALAEGWADWFNDSATTRFLDQGIFPNMAEHQEEFYRGLTAGNRLALLVCDKAGEALYGTISLSNIDWVKRSAVISMVLSPRVQRPELAALEAMARIGEHGFMTMGLNRIWAGQAYPGLAKWNRRLELLGYRTEGMLRGSVAKGRSVSDEVAIAVLYDDYAAIKNRRPYWPGGERVQDLLKRLPDPPLAERIAKALAREQEAYEREFVAMEDEG